MSVNTNPDFKYLFYIAKIYSISIFIPLVKYLQDRCIPYAFYLSKKVAEKQPDAWKNSRQLKSLKEAKTFNADFVLTTGNFVDFRLPGLKVQLFHGLGVEKDVHFKLRHFFDIYLTSGPYVTSRFNEMQKKYKYFLVKETGWPKVDYIRNYQQESPTQLSEIPSGKKIILYAPTFSRQHQSASVLYDLFPDIINDDEFWLVKFHELMDKDIINKYKQIDNSRCKVLDDIEITPYLHAADLMVSDTSSVVYEFMILDKPVVTFRNTGNNLSEFNITETTELREMIDKNLADKDIHHRERLNILKEINPDLKGDISEKVFSTLQQVKKNNLMPNIRKPLNLFRKVQIIYHGLFKKGYMR